MRTRKDEKKSTEKILLHSGTETDQRDFEEIRKNEIKFLDNDFFYLG